MGLCKTHKRPGREALKHRREGALARLESQRKPLVAEVAVRKKEIQERKRRVDRLYPSSPEPVTAVHNLDLDRIDREIAILREKLNGA